MAIKQCNTKIHTQSLHSRTSYLLSQNQLLGWSCSFRCLSRFQICYNFVRKDMKKTLSEVWNDFDPYDDMEYYMTGVCYITKLWVCNIETIFKMSILISTFCFHASNLSWTGLNHFLIDETYWLINSLTS